MDSQHYFRDIASQIESDEYFENAREWYLAKYASLSADVSYFIVLMVFSLIVIVYSYVVIATFYPLNKVVPMTVTISDATQVYSRIIPLAGKLKSAENDPDKFIVSYLLNKYVQARESYNYENNYELLERNKRFVQNFSTTQISRKFESALTIRNPDSPILRYRNHTIREIGVNAQGINVQEIKSIRKRMSQDKRPLLSYRADVIFKSTEIGPDGEKDAKWKAVIDYLYSPVTYNREKQDFDQMEFMVTNYQVAELN